MYWIDDYIGPQKAKQLLTQDENGVNQAQVLLDEIERFLISDSQN
jgi:hypothetical protein